MGGGSGGIIVRNVVIAGLTDPTVSGQLPAWLSTLISPTLAKDASSWNADDCSIAAIAMQWALCNLQ